jgi:hypothetical protein
VLRHGGLNASWEWEAWRDYDRMTGTANTALEAMEAADNAAKEAK